MTGDGSVGYLHATQPTLTSGGKKKGSKKNSSNVYRLRQDEACGVTIDIRASLHSDTTVEIQFAEVHFRDAGAPIPIDTLGPTQYGQLPTKETLQTEADLSPLNSDHLSRQKRFRVWKNASESGRTILEVSAIASISIIRNTPRTVSGEPPLYQFDLFVAGKKVLLHYCFVDRRRAYLGGEQLPSAPPRRDSRRGMFFAGSAPATPNMIKALKARSLPDEPPDARSVPDEVLDHGTADLLELDLAGPFADELLGTPSEQRSMLPLVDMTPDEVSLAQSLSLGDPSAGSGLGELLSAPPKRDSGRGMVFAGSAPATPNMIKALEARSLPDEPPDDGTADLEHLLEHDPTASFLPVFGEEDDPIKPKSCGSPDCMAGTEKFLGGVYEGMWYVCICKPYEARAEDNPPPPPRCQ